MKLDIGSGAFPIPGFIGVDPFVSKDGIVNADMWDLPYADDSIEEIYSSHALEHVEKRKIIPTLQEWRRVLAPDGMITVAVPDLEWCCKAWLENPGVGWYLDILYGNQTHPGEFHKTGFTRDIMLAYLGAAGFKEAKFGEVFDHEQNTLVFIVRKDGVSGT